MDSPVQKPDIEALAGDIMLLSRNSLLVNFRFLDRAIAGLQMSPAKDISLATDGCFLYYGPRYILSVYKGEQTAVTRDILHSLLHCVFRHNLVGRGIDRLRWDLAADVAVENMITEFSSGAVKAKRAALQYALTEVIKKELGPPLTAERIYRWLKDGEFTEEELEQERECFYGDGHGIWYGESDPEAKYNRDINLRKIWEDISKRMQTEMETMLSDRDSALVQNLRSLNRTRRSYTDFLRRFGVHGEIMKLSDEEFDNNYYSYGLELYGNIPLIEPLEYSEQKRIREFVIGVDTSGSVKGEVVQSFMQHTYDILKRQDSFFEKVSVYIIQCDDRIQDSALITCREDFDRYIEGLEIKGLGRTDFRPVFTYVSGLIAEKKLTNLQGLIYFTDGKGTFPREKPDYDTAFIIHGQDYNAPELPSWAQNIVLTEEDILDRRFSDY